MEGLLTVEVVRPNESKRRPQWRLVSWSFFDRWLRRFLFSSIIVSLVEGVRWCSGLFWCSSPAVRGGDEGDGGEKGWVRCSLIVASAEQRERENKISDGCRWLEDKQRECDYPGVSDQRFRRLRSNGILWVGLWVMEWVTDGING
ncbi:hypothetical protein HAX54_026970 [Datura stramonium]|uniref:Uncharacterized protein n=1 Tax=Datura stramonium TaxID=4076 RepID=A0ABS8V414_DATST|nr:hypothetical protein [Datura stramonium]